MKLLRKTYTIILNSYTVSLFRDTLFFGKEFNKDLVKANGNCYTSYFTPTNIPFLSYFILNFITSLDLTVTATLIPLHHWNAISVQGGKKILQLIRERERKRDIS